ncbi:hypothetical protein ACN27G_09885 [Plantactinospora sp. WMMB334]|uniref:hypothetical protein n=1 Tax=Plantactinospora sp. WMMB334 TaxID=3404119 RepID=UPI003B9556A0
MTAVGTVAVIGAEPLVRGFGLAGAVVLPAGDAERARAAWRQLPADVSVVILTPAAATAVEACRPSPGTGTPFVVVMT